MTEQSSHEAILVVALARDLTASYARQVHSAQGSVVIWFDPDQEFSRLIPDLRAELETNGFALLVVDSLSDQFATKMELIRREADDKSTVVYAPGIGPEAMLAKAGGLVPGLWALVDYRYKGVIWYGTDSPANDSLPPAVTLDRWLERHGVSFPPGSSRSKLAEGGRDSRLARFAARRARRRLDHWPRPLTDAVVREELAGDPRDSVIKLLLDPKAAVLDWGDDREDALERVGATYGLRFGDADPESIADDVAVALAVTDAWDVFGRLDDFPFAARLPRGPHQRDRVLALLRSEVLPRGDVLPRFRARIARLEPDLSVIETWAADKPGVPAALPHLLEVRVRRLLERLTAAWADGPAACLQVLDADLASASIPEDAHATLAVLYQVRRLAKATRNARDESVSGASPGKLVDRYSKSWWSMDAAYLAILADCRDDAELITVSALASRLYFDYVDAANQRFSDLLESEPAWPPVGTRTVADVAAKIWAPSKQRQAVFIVDALRFDLARQVADALGPGASVDPLLTTLPSTTPFGMTALLPIAPDELSVSYDSDKLSIAAGQSRDLEQRAGRKAYLESFLAARDPAETIAFAELESIAQGDAIPKTRWLVVFNYALDDRGHSLADAASLPGEAEKLVPRLVRAIERLHRAGVDRVDIVTDHGFLYLPPELTDSLGHPDLPAKQAISKNARYAVLQADVAATEVVHRPSPMAPGITLGFPRGMRTLSKAYVYLHGGISLQECVIGRISSQAALAAPRVEVEIDLTVAKITGATIPVRVRPIGGAGSGQMTLAAPRPVKVRLYVEAAADGSVVEVADPVILEVRTDSPELVTALYLREGIRLASGTVLNVRATDAASGESLFSKQVPLVVDWEG